MAAMAALLKIYFAVLLLKERLIHSKLALREQAYSSKLKILPPKKK